MPIYEQRNDGRDNLLGALVIAGHYVIPEVSGLFILVPGAAFHSELWLKAMAQQNNSNNYYSYNINIFYSTAFHEMIKCTLHHKK